MTHPVKAKQGAEWGKEKAKGKPPHGPACHTTWTTIFQKPGGGEAGWGGSHPHPPLGMLTVAKQLEGNGLVWFGLVWFGDHLAHGPTVSRCVRPKAWGGEKSAVGLPLDLPHASLANLPTLSPLATRLWAELSRRSLPAPVQTRVQTRLPLPWPLHMGAAHVVACSKVWYAAGLNLAYRAASLAVSLGATSPLATAHGGRPCGGSLQGSNL